MPSYHIISWPSITDDDNSQSSRQQFNASAQQNPPIPRKARQARQPPCHPPTKGLWSPLMQALKKPSLSSFGFVLSKIRLRFLAVSNHEDIPQTCNIWDQQWVVASSIPRCEFRSFRSFPGPDTYGHVAFLFFHTKRAGHLPSLLHSSSRGRGTKCWGKENLELLELKRMLMGKCCVRALPWCRIKDSKSGGAARVPLRIC